MPSRDAGLPSADFSSAIPVHEALILSRLERRGGNAKAARESLGLTKATFHRSMKGLGISGGRTSASARREQGL